MAVRKARPAEPGIADVVSRMAPGYKTVGQMVYAVIKECVMTGVFAPGEHLRQEELAERIGVSRIPVRTALMQLEAEGLVSFHPHRGAVVSSLTVEQVREIYEIRTLLEPHALRKSIARMTSARAARLRELGAALDEEHEGQELIEQRVAFYRELYDAEGSPILAEMIEDLRAGVGRYLLGLRVDQPAGSHLELARLATRGDVAAAERFLMEHLDHVCRRIIELLSDEEEKGPEMTTARRPARQAPTPSAGSRARSNPA